MRGIHISEKISGKILSPNLIFERSCKIFLVPHFDEQDNFVLKLPFSNTCLCVDNLVHNEFENYYDLCISNNNKPILFYESDYYICANINECVYVLMSFRGKIVLCSKNYKIDPIYEYSNVLYKELEFTSVNFKFSVNAILLDLYSKIKNLEDVGDEMCDVFNIILVYHGIRPSALIQQVEANEDILNAINLLNLKIVPRYDNDEMFITLYNLENKQYTSEEAGKILGYVSYMYNDWMIKGNRTSLELDANEHQIFGEVLQSEHLRSDMVDHYLMLEHYSEEILKSYDSKINVGFKQNHS
jgi:hypothetical protein